MTGNLRRILRSSLLIPLLVVATTVSAAAKTATFLMVSGTKYEQVNYKVKRNYRLVEIIVDSKKMNLLFSDIAAVYDREGQDITRDVLRRRSFTTEDGAAGDSVAASEWDTGSRRSEWVLLISGVGAYNMPSSSYYFGFDAGFGFEADIMLPLSPHFALGTLFARSGLTPDPDEIRTGNALPYWKVLSNDLTVGEWKLALMGNYMIERKQHRDLVYLGFGAGVVFVTSSGQLVMGDLGANEGIIIKVDQHPRFVTPIRTGYILGLNKALGFNFGVGLDLYFQHGDKIVDPETAALLQYEVSVRAGLTFGLRRKK